MGLQVDVSLPLSWHWSFPKSQDHQWAFSKEACLMHLFPANLSTCLTLLCLRNSILGGLKELKSSIHKSDQLWSCFIGAAILKWSTSQWFFLASCLPSASLWNSLPGKRTQVESSCPQNTCLDVLSVLICASNFLRLCVFPFKASLAILYLHFMRLSWFLCLC